MPPSSPEHPLSVSGELSATYDGVVTRLQAAGSSLRWHIGDASTVLPGIPVTGRDGIANAASRLADAGLTLEIRDERGRLLNAGAIRPSLVGRMLLGSPQVRLRRLWRWPSLARHLR